MEEGKEAKRKAREEGSIEHIHTDTSTTNLHTQTCFSYTLLQTHIQDMYVCLQSPSNLKGELGRV